jgi:hypothetical protein
MSPFRKSPSQRPKLQRLVPRPWDPPESEFPAIVPIDTLPFGRSDQAAIAIIGIWAYTGGFEIFIARRIRPDIPGLDEDPTPRGGDGTTHSQFFRWWAWPLPPRGALEFVCQWPMYGIAETRVGVDAQLILDAAQRAVRLWPAVEG